MPCTRHSALKKRSASSTFAKLCYDWGMKNVALALLLAVSTTFGTALANENPSFQKPTDFSAMSPAENAFVAAMQADLNKRFPTAADAERAGYVRYTNPDETGAISYTNKQFQSADVHHP